MIRRSLIAAALLLGAPGSALAVQPDEQLQDPKLEARARAISQELRCLVCQNQDIDDSDAPLARDLRLLLRERISKGDTDAQARDYIVQRYGNFVLLKPPVEGATLPLWLGPAAFVLIGGTAAFLMLRRRRTVPGPAPLTEAERARLDALLGEDRP